jgi:type VI secretion system protein ImpK
MQYFNTRLRFERFWVRAQEATTLERRDALEVYYVCVVLGFRGLYRNPDISESLIRDYGLPPDVDAWARQTAMSIRLGQRRAAMPKPMGEVRGAPPMRMKAAVLWIWWLVAILAAVNLVVFALFWYR